MNFGPILTSKLNNFKKNYNLESYDDHEAFELFINNLILRTHQPEAFSVINDTFDQVCVGGNEDTGIDGLAIKVNDMFVATKADIDDIIKKQNRICVDFIFIQSKYKKNLDSGEFGKFMDGVTDFLSEKQCEPHNAKIEDWLEIKNYICSEDVLIHWDTAPKVRIYYAYTGQWNKDPHIIAKYERAKSDINSIGLYDCAELKCFGEVQLKKLCDDVDNQFKKVITIIDSLELNEVPSVESSRILFCSAIDFIQLLINDDGELRKSLFKDNVRDYQGSTDINDDIFNTIKSEPENFCLLNNGITIVCKSMMAGNRKISIENPQIVNGCQTCNTIYRAYKEKINISDVTLIIKLIATDNMNVTNSIVKGTNRQNIVYEEAFEITREFHKNLEEFIETIQQNVKSDERVYYERRSNQFLNVSKIKAIQKANFKLLIQSFVSIILQSPHEGFVHESGLLEKYKNKIFIDGQSFYPYYMSIVLHLKVDRYFKENREKYKFITTYKHQILCILVEKAAGVVPDINNGKKIDSYCQKVLDVINNHQKFIELIDASIKEFNEIKQKWIADKGVKYKYAVKDNALFTQYMLTYLRGGSVSKLLDQEKEEESFRGTVTTVKKDRNDLFYGFIKKSPTDVFIHEDDNPKVRFNDLSGKDVVYRIIASSKYNTPRGQITYVINDKE